LKHLRAIVLDKRVSSNWSDYLPMVQWIVNSAYIHELGTSALRMRFGDSISLERGFSLERVQDSDEMQTNEQYIQQLNTQLYNVLAASIEYNDRKQTGHLDNENSLDINVGDYVLASYPDNPPTKLAPLYRGPMIVLEKIRNEGYICQDIISQHQLQISKDRIKRFKTPPHISQTELQNLAAADHDEFVVDEILDMQGDPKKKKTLNFLVKWKGCDNDDNTWEPYSNVRDLIALRNYLDNHPEIKIK
jgi:hypothetical protein